MYLRQKYILRTFNKYYCTLYDRSIKRKNILVRIGHDDNNKRMKMYEYFRQSWLLVYSVKLEQTQLNNDNLLFKAFTFSKRLIVSIVLDRV